MRFKAGPARTGSLRISLRCFVYCVIHSSSSSSSSSCSSSSSGGVGIGVVVGCGIAAAVVVILVVDDLTLIHRHNLVCGRK